MAATLRLNTTLPSSLRTDSRLLSVAAGRARPSEGDPADAFARRSAQSRESLAVDQRALEERNSRTPPGREERIRSESARDTLLMRRTAQRV
ncbi:hypothetical protein EYF80_029158 [Liparis tanakae]|uniref:Uncharacterized protein n=1 Tax=Liparis tanakae TaxID=230148 RepID=A0A4Z2H3W5_9TELE|nr:hypothetical protein EYF80_029158 [Liparis tanakae]